MKWRVPLLAASTLLAFLGCSKVIRYAQGDEHGQCLSGGKCNAGLTCVSNICVSQGSNPTGGTIGSGGATSTGGEAGSGGSGGNDETGGTSGSGGAPGTGGEASSGGTSGSGGSDPSGGSSGSGGSGGAGGSGTNACNATAASNTVAFCNGLALGAMTGYGWVALGSADTISDPTCDAAKAAITKAAPCKANTNWNKADALCMTGSIPALDLDAATPDYTGNWGVEVGVNAKDPNAGIGTSWKTITIGVSGSPSSGLRAVLHKYGDADDIGYCAPLTPGTALNLTDLKTNCWDSTGTALTESDAASIDKVGVQVTSTGSAISVDNLCLTKIEFGN
jgi:hypothetical protein